MTQVGMGITVAGIFSQNVIGTLSVNYILDGVSYPKTYSVTNTTPEFTQGEQQQDYYVFFANQTLEPGDHTLEMQVTKCQSLVFELDYILYTASFNSLASKSSPSPLPSGSRGTGSSSSSNIATIVGSVLGSVTVLLLILILVLSRKKIFKQRKSTPPKSSLGTSYYPILCLSLSDEKKYQCSFAKSALCRTIHTDVIERERITPCTALRFIKRASIYTIRITSRQS